MNLLLGGEAMFRRRSSFIRRVIKGIEQLLLRIIVIGLVLLVTVQIILTNPKLEESLITKVPIMKEVLTLGQNEDFKIPATTVFSTRDKKLVVLLQNDLRTSKVKLLINGEVRDTFVDGYTEVNLKSGDEIAIDTKGVPQGLWFEISESSFSLISFEVGRQFWIKNDCKVLGRVDKEDKF